MAITLKTPEDIEHMRVAGRLAAEVLQVVAPYVKPGVTTAELDRVCHDHIVNVQHAIPANVGYGGGHGRIPFPFTVCTSVNNVICHGMPSEGKVLKDGDTVNIDVTVIKDGWHGDTSRMYYVGTPSVMAKRLVETTREAMFRGIRTVKPGATLGRHRGKGCGSRCVFAGVARHGRSCGLARQSRGITAYERVWPQIRGRRDCWPCFLGRRSRRQAQYVTVTVMMSL